MESLGFCVDSRGSKDGGLGHKSGSGVNGQGGANSPAPPQELIRVPPIAAACEASATPCASATDAPRTGIETLLDRARDPRCTIAPCAQVSSRALRVAIDDDAKPASPCEALVGSATDSFCRVFGAGSLSSGASMMIPAGPQNYGKTT